jgi:tetratricopeptide (TPR) repeat protein
MRDHDATPHERLPGPAGLRARDVLPACFVFAVALSVFLFTLAPTITFGDSGELIAAAITLGVAHPPGYPLWLILAKFFSLFPVGTIAYRLNLMSAILDAAAVGILTLVISRSIPKVCGRIIPREAFESPVAGVITGSASATAALILAFSPTFWQQSVIAEVYALNNLFVSLILLFLILWGEAPQKRGPLLALSFLFGAGQGNHQTLLLMGPAVAIYIFLRNPRIVLSPRILLGCLALFFLGLCLYLYLPIRASAHPPLNWGSPNTWDAFWFHVLRMQYRNIEVVRPLSVLAPQLKFFFSSTASESLPVILLLPALFTLWFARGEGRAWLLFTLAAFVFTGILLVILANTELDLNAQDLLKVYFLPAYTIVAVWIGYGISIIGLLALRSLRRLRREAIPMAAVTALWLLLPASNLVLNHRQASMRGHDFGHLYGDMLINSLRREAVLLAGTDSSYSIPMYLKWVEGRRPDVSILSVNRLAQQNYGEEVSRNAPNLAFLTPQDYVEAFSHYASAAENMSGGVYGSRKVTLVNGYLLGKLLRRNIAERPLYYEEGMPIEWVRDVAVPSGLVMELKERRVTSLPAEAIASDTEYWRVLEVKLLGDDNFLADIAARQKFSKCRSNIGALYFHRSMYTEAEAALKQAIRLSDRNIEAYAVLAVMYREQGEQGEAVRIFDEYLRRDPWNTSARAFAQSLKQ